MRLSSFVVSRRLLALTALLALVAALLPLSSARSQSAPDADIVEIPVDFEVVNRNSTPIVCNQEGVDVNGQTYTLSGVLTAPADALDDEDATVTLILHGLGYGSFFSNFELVDGYDFARKQAEAGNITVAIDRLGYDESPMPNGFETCLGAQADMANQVIVQLRRGEYQVDDRDAPAFSQVVLAGHSVGGLLAQAVAYSFEDAVDGLVVLSYSDVVVSDLAMQYAAEAVEACSEEGGQLSERGAPGYVAYGEDPVDFVIGHFATGNADPQVTRLTVDRRNINPCGDLLSFSAAVNTNLRNLDQIDVPVLVLAGEDDAFFPPPAVERQAELFTGAESVTTEVIADTGHALTLHLSRDEFASEITHWLQDNGF